MTIRHVIVEGPDGGGKSTLVNYLVEQTPLVKHARASDSATGPVPNLHEWFMNDMRGIDEHPPSVYDRHPLISEPIYSRWARLTNPQVPFDSPAWLDQSARWLGPRVIVVWCLPDLGTVYDNTRTGVQMAGVKEHILDIYSAYHNRARQWPGMERWYNYKTHSRFDLVAYLKTVMDGAI